MAATCHVCSSSSWAMLLLIVDIYSLCVLCAYEVSQTFKLDPRIIDCENVYCSGLRWKQDCGGYPECGSAVTSTHCIAVPFEMYVQFINDVAL